MGTDPQTRINYSEKWADFIQGLTFSKLTDDVVHRMKRSLLDNLGVTVIGSRSATSRILTAYVKAQSAKQESTIVPDGARTTSYYAALVNGTNAHVTEMAESFTRGTMHAGNIVPPATIAVAERVEASGKDLITAMAAGYEIAIRAALACRTEKDSPTFAAKSETRFDATRPTFWHVVPTIGVYGAAAAAAKLLQLDGKKTAQALRLCTSITPAIGMMPAIYLQGAMAKDAIQGFGNAMGVFAADLAAQGFTGPLDVTSHLGALIPDYEPTILLKELGARYLISSGGLHFKLHQTAGMTQSAADALLNLLQKRRVTPEEIETIQVWTNMRGTRGLMIDPDPPNGVAAKVSIPYVVSAVITFYGDVLKDPHFTELYSEEKVANETRSKLAHKVKINGSEEFERGFEREWPMKFPSKISIMLKSGETLTGESEIWSVSSNLPDEKVIAKFKDVAGRVLPHSKVETAVEKVFAIDGLGTIDELMQSVCL